MSEKNGILFVVSAPSGTGKTTLLGKVMSRLENVTFSVSHTTRAPRPGEQDGREYYFVDHTTFEKMIADGEFLEYAEVHDNYYGTSLSGVSRQLAAGVDVILDIDVQGAAIVRDKGEMTAAHIFIAPPSIEALEARLRGRDTETSESLATRLANSRIELKAMDQYDFLVVNDELSEAAELLYSIILAERARRRRDISGRRVVLELSA